MVSVTQDLDNRQGVIGTSSGSVNVTAGGRVDNSQGSLKAETALIVNAAAMLNQTGMMLGSTIALTGLSLDNNKGVIVASTGAATVTTRGRLDNTLGKIQAKTNLVVNGAALINQSGTLLGKTVSVTGSSLDNRQGTVVASNGIAQVVTVEKLDNTEGTLQASSGLVVSGAELINQNGNMLGETTTVTGTSLDNQKGLIGSSNGVASVTVSGDLDNTQGTLNAATDLVVKGGGLVNQSGKLLGQTVTVTGTSLDNNAGVIASSSGAVSVTTDARLDSTHGTLQAFTDLIVRGAELVNHGGKLLGKTVDVIGSSLENNSGLIASSSGTVKVTTDNGLDNTDGILQAATDLVVGGADLVNQRGKLIGDTVVVTGSSLDNRAGLIGARTGALQVTTGGRLDSTQGTLQAETDLVVVAGEVVNQSGTVLGKTVTITGTSLDNSKKGSIIADTGDLKITIDQAVNNQQGRLQSTVGDITLTVGSLDNQLGVVVGEKVAVTTLLGALDNRGGQILGTRLDVDAKTSIDNRNAGQLVGGSDGLKLTTKRISNQQGTILAGGSHAELVLGQGRLDNQAGNISASSVGLTAGDVDNSAGSLTSLNGNLQLTVDRVTNRGGLIEASQKLLLDGQTLDNSAGGRLLAHLGDLSRVALKGDLDNRNGRIAIGSQAFSLQASTLFNSGGKIEHAATGLFSLRSANLLSNQGQMIGLGAGDWNVTNVNGVGLWHMNGALDIKGLQSISLQAGDRIASASSLSLEAANLTNSGELLGDGNLTLKLSGDLVNQGLISTQKALSIKAANLTQNGGRIASAGEAGLTINGTLDNLGRLTSGTHLTATADRIVNRGTLGAQRLLKLTAVKDIDNQQDSLIFAGGDMALRADSLFNKYADIYSAGNFSFAAVDGNRASLLSNLSASIESAGDIDIKTRELDNSKAEFESTQEAISREMLMDCDDCSGDVHSGSYIVRTNYQGAVLKDSPASRLLANRDLLLDAVTVTNGQSLLAANRNATITATNFYNRGFTLDNRVENVNYYLRSVSQSAYRVAESATNAWNRKNVGLAMEDQAPIPTAVTRYGIRDTTSTILPGNGATYTGTVQAGGTLKLNISNELVNGSLTDQGNAQLTGATLDSSTVGAGGRQVILGAPVGSAGAVKDVQRIQTTAADGSVKFSFVPVDFSGAPFVSVDPTSLSSFRLPQGSFGLFTQNRNPAAQYLIETNPSLVDTAKFMSSDYLLSNLGYDPAEADRRLGDGRYESRLIADAVRAQTGQRFLADGISSDYEQFQYLMDNAVASKDELGLSLGVGLTSEQVAALTHDLVWMEERVVEGETVLTPVLYLAKVDSRNLRGGSLIQGRNVEMITGGDLKNVGTLRASEDLTALSGGSIYQGGLVQANNNLTMLATNSIRNALAGEIRGDKVNLTTLTGDIINDRTAVQFTIGNDTRTQLDAGSSITAGSELTINAGKDLTNKGQISSGGNAALTAGNDINLLSVEDRNVEKNVLRRGMRTEETITQMGSSVTAKGDLSLKAGNDINAVASKASAGRDLTVEAGNDVNLMSAADEHNLESRFKSGSKKIHQIDNQGRQVASEFSAGRDLILDAKNDVNVVSSQIKAQDEAYVYAGNDLNLMSAHNTDYSYYSMTKKGSWGKKSSKMSEGENDVAVSSSVDAGKKVSLSAGQDFLAEGAKVNSGGALLVSAGNNVTLDAAENYTSQANASSKKGLFSSKSSSASASQSTVTGTELHGDTINVQADNDISLNAAALYAQQSVKLIAGRDVEIGTALQQQTSSQSSQTSKFRLNIAGAPSLSQKAQSGQQGSSQSIGTSISADSLDIQSGRDTAIRGSTLVTDNGLSISAGRNLDIASAENQSASNSKSSSKKAGEIGSWWQGATGVVKLKDGDQNQSTRQSGSQVASLGGSVNLTAGEHYNQVASQVIAPKGDISITAKDVDILSGFDLLSATHTSSSNRTAIGGSINIPLLDAARGVQQAVQSADKTSDPRMLGLAAANAAMSGKQAYDAAQSILKDGVGFKVSVSLSNSKSHSESNQSGQNVVSSSLAAGGDINVTAKGAGKDSTLNVVGSRIDAGHDVNLKSDGDINLVSAQNTAVQKGTNGNSGGSVGIGFTVGGTQNGFTLDLAANKGMGKSNGHDVTQTNTQIKAGNKASLDSANDTNLKGAVVSANQVQANVGGDLNLSSLQDTSKFSSKQVDASVGVSICIPPFCYGVSGSASFNQQKTNSDYASVSEQTGIKAGDAGFQINVKGNTALNGAVIASSDKAVTDGKNTLSTGTLTSSDIKNKASYDASSIGLSGSTGEHVGRDADGNQKAGAPGTPVPKNDKISANAPIALFTSGDANSVTRSGISGATVKINDDAKQQALTGQTAAEAVAAINTDVSSDRDGSNKLKPIFNPEEIQVGFDITAKFVQNVGVLIESKTREADRLRAEADKEKALANNPNAEDAQAHRDEYLRLNQQARDIENDWGAGGTYRQIATALVAGASGNVGGSTAQLAQNMVVNYVQQQGSSYIGKLVAAGLPEGSAEHSALHAILGCAGAAASNQSCSAGALAGSASSVLAGLLGAPRPDETNEEREAKRNIVTSLVTGIAAITDPGSAATANTTATANVDNNWLADAQKAQRNKELAEATSVLDWLSILGKWDRISANQGLASLRGFGKGFTDEIASTGLDTLNGAANFLAHPKESIAVMNEFILTADAQKIFGDKLDEFKQQLDLVSDALEHGGDLKSEQLGKQIGGVFGIFASAVAGGEASIAKGASILSKAGIDVSSSSYKALAVEATPAAVQGKISKLQVITSTEIPKNPNSTSHSTDGETTQIPDRPVIPKRDPIVSGIPALTELSEVEPTAGGFVSSAKLNAGGYAITDLTPSEKALARQVADGVDQSGALTEQLVESVSQRQGLKSLDGGKYGSNNGFDHVYMSADGKSVIILDSKQINGGVSFSQDAEEIVQMSDQWVDKVLERLDKKSAAYKSVAEARENGSLVKGVAGVDRKSGQLIIAKLK
ncbi:hemagglutinin repeat-containing protein [Pseudomonas syringae]|nr:hemagglutinin repeat-containing protein [Pseudomonas syringae]